MEFVFYWATTPEHGSFLEMWLIYPAAQGWRQVVFPLALVINYKSILDSSVTLHPLLHFGATILSCLNQSSSCAWCRCLRLFVCQYYCFWKTPFSWRHLLPLALNNISTSSVHSWNLRGWLCWRNHTLAQPVLHVYFCTYLLLILHIIPHLQIFTS